MIKERKIKIDEKYTKLYNGEALNGRISKPRKLKTRSHNLI